MTAHPIRNAAFRAVLLTRLFSALTGGFYNVPIMWWVLEQTGSGSMIASVGLVRDRKSTRLNSSH